MSACSAVPTHLVAADEDVAVGQKDAPYLLWVVQPGSTFYWPREASHWRFSTRAMPVATVVASSQPDAIKR
jgi:hypothetical protein